MLLSVVIVNYNVRPFLENCLHSVQKAMTGIDGEVFVVDNASDDGSIEMVREKFPGVKLIDNPANIGFAAANNLALGVTKGEFILLLNPDTIVQEDSLSVMLRFLRENKSVGLAGCKILNPDGSLQLACRRSFPTPWVAFTKIIGLSAIFPNTRLFGKYNLEYLDPDQSYEVDAVSGSFMFVRRKAYEDAGNLDEQFFMYGEDLDWCYRIKKAGWIIYYVHETKVIHFKGESVRRSDINELKLFYRAMRLFVKKHFSRGLVSTGLLNAGIGLREIAATLARALRLSRAPLLDFLLVGMSMLAGEYIWLGEIFRFPDYGYPVIFIVPASIVIATMYFFGVYTKRKMSYTHASGSVLFGYILLSALTFFFKQYGFSRMVLAISGLINIVMLPGWRIVARSFLGSRDRQSRSLFGRRTLIVGVDKRGEELLRKLRTRIDDGYEVVGFVDTTRKKVGDKVSGVEIVGSIDNIGKLIEEKKVSEVIFSADSLPYADILSVIARGTNRGVNFRMVPNSLGVIIGKTHIDELDDIPLVDIEYNIHKLSRKIIKRGFDLALGSFLLLFVFPFFLFRSKSRQKLGRFGKKIIFIPDVMRGKLSLVGPPDYPVAPGNRAVDRFYGKTGITGLVQINFRNDLTGEEIEKYNLYYARNQSLILDIEIMIKTMMMLIKKEGYNG